MNLLLLALLLQAASPQTFTPQPAIEPTWVYITPLRWKRAPRGIHERSTRATVIVLYPEVQYFQIASYLIERPDKTVVFSAGDGNLIATGTWARTDEDMIRIHSRDVWWDPETVAHQPEQPHPMPFITDTCRLEGKAPANLATIIHCQHSKFSPMRLNLSFTQLKEEAATGFAAAPLE
jgi:hypothetical protein